MNETAALQRILLVDDELDIQMVARMALEDLGGFEVETAGNGREALEAIGRGPLPDLILLDVGMPELDGPATLQTLRQMPGREAIPVAFLTAAAQPEEIAHYLRLGAVGTIKKPFDPMGLAGQVRELWSLHCATVEDARE